MLHTDCAHYSRGLRLMSNICITLALVRVPRHLVRSVFKHNFPLTKHGTIEHVVPQSLAPHLKHDVHNFLWLPRHLNCARGRKRLDIKTTSYTWEPPDHMKGMYARSVLYSKEFAITLDEDLAIFWNDLYPATPAEKRASASLGILQGNMNEFIIWNN